MNLLTLNLRGASEHERDFIIIRNVESRVASTEFNALRNAESLVFLDFEVVGNAVATRRYGHRPVIEHDLETRLRVEGSNLPKTLILNVHVIFVLFEDLPQYK